MHRVAEPTGPKLTPKQTRFVEEYLVDLNASAAALRAGYKSGDIGRQLITKTHVQEAIAAAKAKRSLRTQIKADRVLRELARIAFSDMRRLVAWGPDGVSFIDSACLSAAAAACVAEVSQIASKVGKSIKIKVHPKPQALNLLGQHLGLFRDKALDEMQREIDELKRLADTEHASDPGEPESGDP
jgi:phage terminase small subunit